MEAERIGTIENVFCDVFENMAFMFGELVDKDELANDESKHTQALISFSGAQTGSISLIVPDDMCPEIAANVLGIEPDDDQVHDLAADALKEMINIICGRLLTEIAGEKPVFDLSVPEVQNIGSQEWFSMQKEQESLGFIVDEYPVLFIHRMES